MVNCSSPDYALAWPHALLADELDAVLASDGPVDQIPLLLEEAFAGPTAADRWRNAGWQNFTSGSQAPRTAVQFELQKAARRGELQKAARRGELKAAAGRPPLWSQRHAGGTPPSLDGDAVRRQYASLAVEFFTNGYFARDAPLPVPTIRTRA